MSGRIATTNAEIDELDEEDQHSAPVGDHPSEPVNANVPAPALDSIEEEVMRRRLHAQLFGSEPGVWIDRFELLEKLGAGGMGSVWAARDHRLGRRVALKFLRSHLDGSVGEQRLFREAQALARLAHPNVVSVFDVGRHEGRVWIAMELVPGRTLREWASEGERPASQILAHWLAAGAGLAAIHEGGLIHRDVKPDNVLLGDDGRVRIVDLGLVRALGEDPDEFEGTLPDTSNPSGASTEVGAATRGFVGTPAYAPPEQSRGGPIDARADQYSFCVSLWEALTGERPTPESLSPAPKRMPRRVHAALVRGLGETANQRFASMPELLEALAPPRRRNLAALGLGLGLVATLAAGLAGAFDRAKPIEPEDPCAQADAGIDARWTDERRKLLEAEFEGGAGQGLIAAIDSWVGDWQASAVESCEDVHVRHVRSEATLEQRTTCLEFAALGLDALLEAVAVGELASPALVIEGLGQLDEPRMCLSDASARQAMPEEARVQIAELRRQLGRAKLGIGEPRIDLRLARTEALIEEAEALGWVPLVAEAQLVRGRLYKIRGDAKAARRAYGEGLDIAGRLDDQRLVAEAWSGMDLVALHLERDLELAEWAWDRLDDAVTRLGAPPRQRGRLALQAGVRSRLANDPEAAQVRLVQAIAAFEEAGPIGAWGRAGALRALADLRRTQGDDEGAKAALAEASAVELGESGTPDPVTEGGTRTRHPSYNAGIVALGAGEFETAQPLLERALADTIAELGPRSFDVARVHVALAQLHDATGGLARARAHAEQADAIYVDAGALDHRRRTHALTALGTVALREGRFEDAVAAYERALRIDENTLAPDSAVLAVHASNLGEGLLAAGDPGRARAAFERARAILEPAENPDLVWPLKGLGALALEQGDFEGAEEQLSRALAGLAETYPLEAAQTRALLARAVAGRGNVARARGLAQEASESLASLGEPWASQARALRAEFDLHP